MVSTTISRLCPLDRFLGVGTTNIFQGQGWGIMCLQLLRSSAQDNWRLCILEDLPQHPLFYTTKESMRLICLIDFVCPCSCFFYGREDFRSSFSAIAKGIIPNYVFYYLYERERKHGFLESTYLDIGYKAWFTQD